MDFGTGVGTIAGMGFAAVAVGIGAAEVADELAVDIEAVEVGDAFADRADCTAWVESERTVSESIVCPNAYLERSLLSGRCALVLVPCKGPEVLVIVHRAESMASEHELEADSVVEES